MYEFYYNKYIKYKTKYLLAKQTAGAICYSDKNNQIKNATGIILVNDNNQFKVLLLRAKNGKWMTPGGNVDKKDLKENHPCKKAFTREFHEETNFDLPPLNNVEKFFWNGHTVIYIGDTDIKNLGKFSPSNETIEMGLFSLRDLVDNNFGNIDLKSYVRSSLKQIYADGLLNRYI